MICLSVNIEKYYNEIFNMVSQFFPLEEIKKDESNLETLLDFFINDVGIKLNYKINDSKGQLKALFEYNRNTIDTIEVKKLVKHLLNELVPTYLPWGVLTGVRPIKIVHSFLDKNLSEEEIISRLKYLEISSDNIKAMLDISKRQRNLVYPIKVDRLSIYIHIPFCPTKCAYCSYNTMVPHLSRENVQAFLKTLTVEIDGLRDYIKNFEIETIYIGGGTPTVLNEKELETLLEDLKEFNVNIREYTVEAGRPDTITFSKLKLLKSYGIDRISINPQTMNEYTLKRIGRFHSVKDIQNIFEMARNVDFKTINSDLIIGLQGENLSDFKNTLKEISNLRPENLTIHTLSIKKGAKYRETYDKFDINNINDMMKYSKEFARKNNYVPYYLYRQKNILGNLENIGYAKEGHESIYNIQMMEERSTILSLGMGGVSKFFFPDENRHESYRSYNDLKLYIENVDEIIKKKKEFLEDILGG